MTTDVELTIKDRVARVRFSSKNGVQLFSASMRSQLNSILKQLDTETDCRVVVFEAEGRTFIAGADIHELRSLKFATGDQLACEGQQLMNRIAALHAVTLVAIHAACAGGGCELALACDLRIAAKSAKIGLPEVTLGLIPGWGGMVRAVRLFGGAVARRMVLTGELFSADAAYRLGIVDAVTADDEFRTEVDRWVEQLLRTGPFASFAAKRLISDFEGPEIRAQLAQEAQAFSRCCAGEESTEGTRAFLEKRPPVWD